MSPPSAETEPRYRRRILALGGVATFALLVIGGPIFSNRVEGDLEQRVPAELAAAGYDGIRARFSGQDGVLTCDRPLEDPEAAIDAAYDVWGVRKIELERSCRVNRAPTVAPTTTEPSTATEDPGDAGVPDDVETTEPPPPTTVPADFASITEILSSTGELELLAVLVQEAGLDATFADPAAGPLTLFAPTDDAFDALAADTLAQLRSDPELLRRVLEHHVVEGARRLAELPTGPVPSIDGGTLALEVLAAGDGPPEVGVDAATVLDGDLTAANGIVHLIDRLLVPGDVDLAPPESPSEVAIVFDADSMLLRGVVASEVERLALVRAAGATGLAVDDQLTVDPDSGLDAATTGTLAEVVAVIPVHLVAATAGSDGEVVYVRGSYAVEADRVAMLAITEPLGVAAELAELTAAEPTDGDDDDDEGDAAAQLEEALNEFVADNPIVFRPSSAVLDPSADAIIDRIASDVAQLDVDLTVEGHTDSDGTPADNLVLSTLRAEVVRGELVARGLDPERVTAVGFGSEQPVLVDGVEDKDASRRVEFRVVVP